MGLRGDDGRSDKKVQSAIPVWKQESRRHGWQFDKAAGIGFVAETLNRHSGPDPESRVFNQPGAESTKDSGLRLPPEWQWARPLNGLRALRGGPAGVAGGTCGRCGGEVAGVAGGGLQAWRWGGCGHDQMPRWQRHPGASESCANRGIIALYRRRWNLLGGQTAPGGVSGAPFASSAASQST